MQGVARRREWSSASAKRLSDLIDSKSLSCSICSGKIPRLEIAVSLDRLRRDCPRIELAAEPEYEPFFVIRGLRELRVRW